MVPKRRVGIIGLHSWVGGVYLLRPGVNVELKSFLNIADKLSDLWHETSISAVTNVISPFVSGYFVFITYLKSKSFKIIAFLHPTVERIENLIKAENKKKAINAILQNLIKAVSLEEMHERSSLFRRVVERILFALRLWSVLPCLRICENVSQRMVLNNIRSIPNLKLFQREEWIHECIPQLQGVVVRREWPL